MPAYEGIRDYSEPDRQNSPPWGGSGAKEPMPTGSGVPVTKTEEPKKVVDSSQYKVLTPSTLMQTIALSRSSDSHSTFTARLERIFNFASGSVITRSVNEASYGRTYRDGVAGNASASVSQTVEKFSDLDADDEIAQMHAKLVELGGEPAPVDRFLRGKQTQPLGRMGTK